MKRFLLLLQCLIGALIVQAEIATMRAANEAVLSESLALPFPAKILQARLDDLAALEKLVAGDYS
jgi:hypothetical protein